MTRPAPAHIVVTDGPASAALTALVSAARDAILQIEYLHGKFKPTGTGETTLTRLRSALAGADVLEAAITAGGTDIPEDFISHRHAWHGALVQCKEAAEAEGATEDRDDGSYWAHEIRAFERAYAEAGIPFAPLEEAPAVVHLLPTGERVPVRQGGRLTQLFAEGGSMVVSHEDSGEIKVLREFTERADGSLALKEGGDFA